jgi:hypothetical protein
VLQRPAVIPQRFHLQAAAVQQMLQTGFDVVVTVQAVALFAARQAGVNRGVIPLCAAYWLSALSSDPGAISTCAAKADKDSPAAAGSGEWR